MYKCKVCNFVASTLRNYSLHYQIHCNVANFRFPCALSTCSRTFQTCTALEVHFSREHSQYSKRNCTIKYYPLGATLKCSVNFCGKEFKELHVFLRHLRQHISSFQEISCPYQKCCSKFYNVKTFSSHLTRKHRNCGFEEINSSLIASKGENVLNTEIENESDNITLSFDEPSSSQDTSNEETTKIDIISSPESISQQYLHNYATFILRMQSLHHMPVSAVQAIFDEFSLLNRIGQDFVTLRLKEILSKSGIDFHTVSNILLQLRQSSIHEEASGSLRTHYLRKKFFMENFKYVGVESLYMGRNELNKPTYTQYIPLKKTLEVLCQDSTVLSQLNNPMPSAGSAIYRDFNDSELSKRNDFFKHNPNCLKLILFQDAFEVVNPLASARSKHKLVGVYMTLANLYPYNQSKVAHFQLVQLFQEKNLKVFGQHKIFSRLVSDLRDLECNGITLHDGSNIKAVVIAIVGDNLGAHTVGGFSENFSTSDFFCRFCPLSRPDFIHQPLTVKKLRTPSTYNANVISVSNSQGAMQSCAGVKFSSEFNKLSFYHVAGPGMPSCLAHDLFEGIVDFDTALALNYFVKVRKYFSYQALNKKISSFGYLGLDLPNKPAPVNSTNLRLGGQAVQNWTLIRLLPIIFGESITDTDDDAWLMLLLLREIIELVCAPQISQSQLSYLQTVVEEYIERRADLFSNVKLRPKHHYLLHYPQLIQMFGPLIHLWSLRFESKHSYFKQVIRHSRNFINVSKMLAEKHQMYQSYLATGERFKMEIISNNFNYLNINNYNDNIKAAILQHRSLQRNPASVCNEVEFQGTTYKTGLYVLIRECDDAIIAGCIIFLIVQDLNLYFVLECNRCLWRPSLGVYGFDEESSKVLECVPFENLLDYAPLPAYNLGPTKLLPLKHKFLRP